MIYGKAAGVVEGVLIWVLFILTLVYMASSSPTSGDVSEITARLNDPKTAQMVATATGMQQDEARKTLTDIEQRVEEAKDDPAKAAAEARRGLQDVATKAAARVEEAAAKAQPYAKRHVGGAR
jgi:hypothetical protein